MDGTLHCDYRPQASNTFRTLLSSQTARSNDTFRTRNFFANAMSLKAKILRVDTEKS